MTEKNLNKDDSDNSVEVNNKQKETKKEDNENVAYAGFWSRYAAFFIDFFVIQIIAIPIIKLLSFLITTVFGNSITVVVFNEILSYIIEFFVLAVYFIFTTYKFQATFGKIAVGITLKKENNKTLSLKEINTREILRIIQASLFFYIPFIVVLFTQKKQGLHDLAVKSVVVYKDPKNGANKWVVGLVIAFDIITKLYILLLISLFVIFGMKLKQYL